MEPIVISTWKHGMAANEAAWKILKKGGSSLDAVEEGVWVAENDPNVLSVGYGGLPDAEGRVTLDAAIMDWKARIGSVVCLEHIKNPVSVARLILEQTEHVCLAKNQPQAAHILLLVLFFYQPFFKKLRYPTIAIGQPDNIVFVKSPKRYFQKNHLVNWSGDTMFDFFFHKKFVANFGRFFFIAYRHRRRALHNMPKFLTLFVILQTKRLTFFDSN